MVKDPALPCAGVISYRVQVSFTSSGDRWFTSETDERKVNLQSGNLDDALDDPAYNTWEAVLKNSNMSKRDWVEYLVMI